MFRRHEILGRGGRICSAIQDVFARDFHGSERNVTHADLLKKWQNNPPHQSVNISKKFPQKATFEKFYLCQWKIFFPACEPCRKTFAANLARDPIHEGRQLPSRGSVDPVN
jgi:hypothetical protein